jgi:Na+/proline symporter
VLTKVSVTIYAGGIVVSELLGIPFWYGAIGVVVFTGIYTVIGGMKAVIYTETLQAIILITGSNTVYIPVKTTTPIAPYQKGIPSNSETTIPPA